MQHKAAPWIHFKEGCVDLKDTETRGNGREANIVLDNLDNTS